MPGMRGVGVLSDLLDPEPACDAPNPYKAVCRRRWSALVHRGPPDAELAATGCGNATGLPHGEVNWLEDLLPLTEPWHRLAESHDSARPAMVLSAVVSRPVEAGPDHPSPRPLPESLKISRAFVRQVLGY